jgi:hypothetical protein
VDRQEPVVKLHMMTREGFVSYLAGAYHKNVSLTISAALAANMFNEHLVRRGSLVITQKLNDHTCCILEVMVI